MKNILILLCIFSLINMVVSIGCDGQIYSKRGKCLRGYCWSYCKNKLINFGGEWCYTKHVTDDYWKCNNDDDCFDLDYCPECYSSCALI
jgi:hypothetical protein